MKYIKTFFKYKNIKSAKYILCDCLYRKGIGCLGISTRLDLMNKKALNSNIFSFLL